MFKMLEMIIMILHGFNWDQTVEMNSELVQEDQLVISHIKSKTVTIPKIIIIKLVILLGLLCLVFQ